MVHHRGVVRRHAMRVIVNHASIMAMLIGDRLVHVRAQAMILRDTWRLLGTIGKGKRQTWRQDAKKIGQGDTPPCPKPCRFAQTCQHLVCYRTCPNMR